jgi:hypothetical protein
MGHVCLEEYQPMLIDIDVKLYQIDLYRPHRHHLMAFV